MRGVDFSGVERNIFQLSERKANIPPPKQEDVDRAQQLLAQAQKPAAPPPAPPKPVDTKPRAPKITWKYYGYATESGAADKRAFLLDGEEIFVATEGDIFKKRYRIVKIGVNSIVVEDLEFRDEQTLPLEQQG